VEILVYDGSRISKTPGFEELVIAIDGPALGQEYHSAVDGRAIGYLFIDTGHVRAMTLRH